MKAILFALAMGLAGSAFAETTNCGQANNEVQFANCLGNLTNSMLVQASSKDGYFGKRFSDLSQRLGLTHEATPMNEAFIVRVLSRGDSDISEGKSCFPSFRQGDVSGNTLLAKRFMNQMGHLVGFLSDFHLDQYGRTTSLLFQVREVRVCDISQNNDRRMIFRNKMLRFGFDRKETMASNAIYRKWQSGDPLRAFDKGYFDWCGMDLAVCSEDIPVPFVGTHREIKVFKHEQGGIRGVIWDRVVDNLWIVLDPTGRERVTLAGHIFNGELTDFVRRMKMMSRKMTSNDLFDQLHSIATSGGFPQKHLAYLVSLQNNPAALQSIHDTLVTRLADSGNMFKLIENAALNANVSGPDGICSSTLLSMRRIQGAINVSNQHNINVYTGSQPVAPWNELFKMTREQVAASGQKTIKVKMNNTPVTTMTSMGTHTAEVSEAEIYVPGCDQTTILADQSTGGINVATSDTVNVKSDIIARATSVIQKMDPTMLKRASLFQVLDTQINDPTLARKP